ncbi:MAG TPA: phosphoglycerate mutase family protein [Ferruginibacter sp.]|nr:phosphoglycerate mutase family protein [Ferruginibacter sp.]HMP21009.1 phosphoglycerate mutase family protein [Ferruginibacter sp.]
MRYLFFCFVLSLSFKAHGQPAISFGKNAVVYIVRHAEKQEGKDPLLTAAGNQRAGDLLREMAPKNIKRIYVTPYKRTQHTADSLRLQLAIDTIQVIADTSCVALFEAIQEHKDRDNPILIITHSNIVQKIIYKLGCTDFPQHNIPDSEFDNLYIIRFDGAAPVLVHKKYGKPSSASAVMQ